MLLILLIVILLLIILNQDKLRILYRDINYFTSFGLHSPFKNLENNNRLRKNRNNVSKILIITFDNRTNLDFIKEHNKNVQAYADKWNYYYKFFDQCKYNVYWCKMYFVLDELNTNNYDYVMWLDSDTIINNFDIDLDSILNMYNSDIYIGNNNGEFNVTNSGVFIIKNSVIGKKYIYDCINKLDKNCINENNKITGGLWTGTCYEQGIMNILIKDKYGDYTTILPNDIIYNGKQCNKNAFILHQYGTDSSTRLKCFSKLQ